MKLPRIGRILTLAVAALTAFGALRAADAASLPAPVQGVLRHYLSIQADLAADSFTPVPAEAAALAKSVRAAGASLISQDVAAQADSLAKASDLASARAAFEPLSASLIGTLGAHHEKGAYVQVYCPMKRASWLQASRTVDNPYLGKEMPSCGIVRN
ncbi:hypothetical protein GALL_85370 [mine drainage metagenome]|uniref:DUF3347 domain-containing protein n=1 Tax=mine drainage metagenome TaxID=410659 RepID=A0A1J5SZ59_9ZZZZ